MPPRTSGGIAPSEWLTGRVWAVSFIPNRSAMAIRREHVSLPELMKRFHTTTAGAKADLPWIKFAGFGDRRTERGSLRHDENVEFVSGAEIDYDGGEVSFDTASDLVRGAGILAILYTSPSHTPERPRWRILVPFATNHPPAMRAKFLGRLNGVLGGIASTESWTLSQSYYWGHLSGAVYEIALIDGAPIDLLDELDKTWMGKPSGFPPSLPGGVRTAALKAEPGPAGHPAATPAEAPAGGNIVPLVDEVAMLEAIVSAASYHVPTMRLVGRWYKQGVTLHECLARLNQAFAAVAPEEQRTTRYKERQADIERCVFSVFEKEAATRDREGTLVPVALGDKRGPCVELPDPDMLVLRLGRRAPPHFPLDTLGPAWAAWVEDAAQAAAAPKDYVALPLLAAASSLIGNARWAQGTPGWQEPPHLWLGVVGDSGSSKSAGGDCLLRDVLPEIERRMTADFPDQLREWKARAEALKAKTEAWHADVREAQKRGNAAPLPPEEAPLEPQMPRLRVSDVTVERLATLLATAAPKGVLIVRDELIGFLLGMNAYHDAGRAFWIEAYGGRPFRVERQKQITPIVVPRLTVAVVGSTQPDKLAQMFREADDGLLSRFLWGWPDPLPTFRLSQRAPETAWAIEALDKLRLLEMASPTELDDTAAPIMVPLTPGAAAMMEAFGQDMLDRQQAAGGLLRSAYGKARGLALRLSMVVAMLHWCGSDGFAPPPSVITADDLAAACDLVAGYFLPMAERVYGDAAASPTDRNAATLARWIYRTRAAEVHVRTLQRTVRLPNLSKAEDIHAAAQALIEAGWLLPPEPGQEFQRRGRAAYAVNQRVHEVPA